MLIDFILEGGIRLIVTGTSIFEFLEVSLVSIKNFLGLGNKTFELR